MSDIARSVYIISDLHLGGVYGRAGAANDRGFRICTHVQALADFVNGIVKDAGESKVELIINGDMVDFLAERNDTEPHFVPFTSNPVEASAKLAAIAGRDKPFFDSLTNLLNHNHRLTILMGNHDIEMAMPAVRRELREILGVKPHHDYEMISNGEAYIVGEALIEHGNRYDQWNVVNYDGLRHISSLMSRNQPIPEEHEFDPPAGSKMVARVINPIKQDYKFIDLLKPETDVAIPTLMAIEPGYRKILATVAQLATQSSKHKMEKDNAAMPSIGSDIASTMDSSMGGFGGDISTYDSAPQVSPEDAALEAVLNKRLGSQEGGFTNSLEQSGVAPGPDIGSDISTANVVDRTLGMAKLFLARNDKDVTRRLPALLQAFRALQPDQSFSRDVETDAVYEDAANELIKGGFRYVIFGHTHLAKQIELKKPGCYYLNSGTWADLIQLPSEIITGEA